MWKASGRDRTDDLPLTNALPLSYVGEGYVFCGGVLDLLLSSLYLRDDHECAHDVIIRLCALLDSRLGAVSKCGR